MKGLTDKPKDGKHNNVSDDTLTRIANQTGCNPDNWTLTESANFRAATYVMSDAQLYKNVTWLVGDAGCGKTTSAVEYRRAHKNVFYILCSEDMKRSDFVREIARRVGSPVDGTNLRDMLEHALGTISLLDNPLLIFDEGDKLTDCVLNYFISIYNRLEGRAGIVFMSTDYMKRRIENGLRYNKKGYKEINSRIGRRFFDLDLTSRNDICSICRANGMTSEADINLILRDAADKDNDLRRVKRMVHAQKRRTENRRQKAEGE